MIQTLRYLIAISALENVLNGIGKEHCWNWERSLIYYVSFWSSSCSGTAALCFVLFEFRSFRSVRTIAGPGGVIGPLPRPKHVGEPPEKNSQKCREICCPAHSSTCLAHSFHLPVVTMRKPIYAFDLQLMSFTAYDFPGNNEMLFDKARLLISNKNIGIISMSRATG